MMTRAEQAELEWAIRNSDEGTARQVSQDVGRSQSVRTQA